MGQVYPGLWWGNLREIHQSGDPGVDGKIILRWIFREVGCEGMNWIEMAQGRDRCEFGNEPSGSLICGEFLD
jgi:hypothetical protein